MTSPVPTGSWHLRNTTPTIPTFSDVGRLIAQKASSSRAAAVARSVPLYTRGSPKELSVTPAADTALPDKTGMDRRSWSPVGGRVRFTRWIRQSVRDYRPRRAVDAAWRRFWDADHTRREHDEARSRGIPDPGEELQHRGRIAGDHDRRDVVRLSTCQISGRPLLRLRVDHAALIRSLRK